ncbi:MAG: hypothetical protein LC131_03705, partial [Anaerolineae bacterium]|nr:hypothetical protein [Anaerolineae bacterium]
CRKGFQLRRDGHYQLSNRIAWAWKMAACGVHVVLMYLGFTGNTYFAADFLRDDAHWQTLMKTYLAAVAPPRFAATALEIGGGSLRFLARSLPVRSVSV